MKFIVVLSLLLLTPTAWAIEQDSCEVWQQKANTFMAIRQQGTPITQAIRETAGNKSRGLMLQAYSEPVADGFEAQFYAIKAFSQKIYDQCLAGQKTADN